MKFANKSVKKCANIHQAMVKEKNGGFGVVLQQSTSLTVRVNQQPNLQWNL